MSKIQLFQGDCLELMKDIPDKSIDLILADLPFGITQNPWDKVIPFSALWEEYDKIAKDNAAFVLFAAQPFTTDLISSSRENYKYSWIWYKSQCTNFLNAKKQPLRNCEDIVVFYRKQCTYNPRMRKGKPQLKATSPGKSKCYHGFESKPHIDDIYYPTTIINIPQTRTKDGHPSQKPVPLLEYLIKTYTNEGETVLDNCMGSGSTGVAAVHTNRDFIGIELDEKYFEIAKERIGKAGEANAEP